MKPVEPTHTRTFIALSSAVLVAGTLLAAGCHKSPGVSAPPAGPAASAAPGPEAFTDQLTEVDGVQAILSIRHPAQVNADLNRLMVAVPEASLLRMALFRLTPFGYPGFSDVGPGSNVGAVILRVSADDFQNRTVATIGFARITEGGKIWELLEQNHLAHLKHGDWVMFGKKYVDLLRLKSPDSVISYLEKPQAEDVRLWGRVTPELLAGFKGAVAPGIKLALATESDQRRKAVLAYLGVVYAQASQLHSIRLSLNFADDALKLEYSFQFLPDSPIGTYLRYRAGPAPAVARYVSGDSLIALAGRTNTAALGVLVNSLMDPLIQVDYPPASGRLKEFRDAYLAYLGASDGGTAGVVDLAMGTIDGRARVQPETFAVMSGHFTREVARQYTDGVQGATVKAMKALMSGITRAAKANSALAQSAVNTDIRYTYSRDAATASGIPLDVSYVSTLVNGREISKRAEYMGVVDGTLVMADSEKALRDHLPALVAKVPLADGIRPPQGAGDQVLFAVNGAKLVDLFVGIGKVDMTDADAKASVDGLKADFAAAGPVSIVGSAGQARMTLTLSVPYKFVESSVHFGQWAGAQKVNLAALLSGAANPAAPAPPPAVDPDQPMPVPLTQ